ncbi:MAG: hypothetical protein AB1521_13345 [Bacteroidota bacterium]
MKIKSIVLLVFLSSLFTTQIAKNESPSFFFNENNSNNNDTLNNLKIISQWSWGACNSIQIYDEYAFIANGCLIQIFNISSPSSPVLIGEIANEDQVSLLTQFSHYLVSYYPFKIFDISNINNIEVVYLNKSIYAVQKIFVDSNFLYLGDFGGGIKILNIEDPQNPIELGHIKCSGEQVTGIAVYNSILFATTADGLTLDIFNIQNKNEPELINNYYLGGIGGDLFVYNNNLFVGKSTFSNFNIYKIETSEKL